MTTVAVIGAGNLSNRRIYPYIGAAGARLAGVCDLDAEKAEATSMLFGGQPFSDYRQMLESVRPDGVIICIGPEFHARLALDVLEMGYAVYTEKPPSVTAADALAVARAAAAKNLLCMTAFKKRYTVCYARAKQWVAEVSQTNQLHSISADYASGYYDNKSPRGEFLLDFALHIIDLVCYLFGDVQEVFAWSVDGHAYTVSLRFVNDALGSLNLSDGRSYTIPTEEVELTASGGNFMTIHNSSCYRIVTDGNASEWREPPTFASSGDSGNDTGHLAELAAFVKALQNNTNDVPSSIYQSYKTMEVYEAIKRSVASGAPQQITVQPL